jgi:dienelactone hydrolase
MLLTGLAAIDVPAAEITINTSDGLTLYADWMPVERTDAPVIVLFHQAGGSARGEYPSIIDHLSGSGYHVLAVDQRNGGDRFGIPNRTVNSLEGREYSYCDAFPDLIAAVAEARSRARGKLAVWGSSYSAGLVVKLASNPEVAVDAALAFSPASGGPMADCEPMAQLTDRVAPLIALRPSREMEVPSVAAQAEAFRNAGVSFHVIEGGVHGSSMLVPDRSQADLEAAWAVVDKFLQETLGQP